MQLTLDIAIHQHENNALSQAHLEEFRDKFSKDCFIVLCKLVAGERLSQREAALNYLSGDLRARIRDLRNPNYGLGIPVSDEWVKHGETKSKVYFMTNENRVEALKIVLGKLRG